MIRDWVLMGMPGVGVVWLLLWIFASYTELDSERDSPLKMGFYLSSISIALWAAITLCVAFLGWVISTFVW